jgi:UDP-N-acetylmuramoylalanine--D-glutamate ligase
MRLSETIDAIARAGKKALVVGLGVKGVESAQFLASRGVEVLLIERLPEAKFRNSPRLAPLLETLDAIGASVHFGLDGERVLPLLKDVGLAVLSPGVSLESAIVGTLVRLGVPYISELELVVSLHQGPTVVITGSNGKSTTAAFVGEILKGAEKPFIRLSNDSSEPTQLNGALLERGVMIVDASSYQLEACTVLKPSISVVLNVSENHLERHGSLERYAAAKSRVFRLQDSDDFSVINADDSVVMAMAKSCRARAAVFGMKPPSELSKISAHCAEISVSSLSSSVIRVSLDGAIEEYDTSRCQLLGNHNRVNIAAGVLVARRLGISCEHIQVAIDSFTALEHRLEILPSSQGIVVINDSKSTTVAATAAAVEAVLATYGERDIALLIGGLSKAGSWSPLLARIKNSPARVSVVCFGKDAPLLSNHCDAAQVPHQVVKDLREATLLALRHAGPETVVLLSPGCASFDRFRDYKERGLEFKKIVDQYREGQLRETA